MPMVQLSPPANQASTTTHTPFGRAYTCAAGQTISVPDFDAVVLQANGWTLSGNITMGPSTKRPVLTASQTAQHFDTTLGKVIYWTGAHWFDASGNQVADVATDVAMTLDTTIPKLNAAPPALPVLGPSTTSFVAGAVSGSLVTAISGLSPGETVTSLNPNDGRLVIDGGATNVLVGLTASSVGATSYTLTTSTGRQLVMAVIVSAPAQVPWTPQNLGSAVVAWWDPSQGVTMNAGGTAVASWTDRVGGIVASQATAANQPGFSATARNGKPGLTFNGTSQSMSFSASKLPAAAADRSFFVAGYTTAAADQKLLTYGSAASGQWVALACLDKTPYAPVINTYASTDFSSTNYPWQNIDRAFYAETKGGVTTSVTEGDLASLQSRANTINTTTAAGYIGQDIRGGAMWTGVIQHILVLNRPLTANERQLMEGWESWTDGKAGANLPAYHPCKSRAPYTSDVVAAPAVGNVPIFFETDMSTDIDDVAAVAVLAYQQKQGNITLIGANTNSADAYSAPCLSALLKYAGLTSVPVGAYQGNVTAFGSSSYTQQVTARFGPAGDTRANYMDPVANLRTQLAAAANGSVVIVSVGFLSNIAALMKSPADGISSMTGLQLVTAKVKKFVFMAGYETSGKEFNMDTDAAASQYVIANIPASIPIVGVGFNFGNQVSFTIPTGGKRHDQPVRLRL